ncbi:MAG: DUF6788 family protein [Acidimicrobiales bacterium]
MRGVRSARWRRSRVWRPPRWCGARWWSHRRRCGKPNCRCASGEELHVERILTYWAASRARSLRLPEELVEPVRAATQRYRQARQELEERGNQGLVQLQ